MSINRNGVYNKTMEITPYQIVSFSIILIFSLILSVQDLKRQSVMLYVQAISILCAIVCQVIFLRAECWIYILTSLFMGGFYFFVRMITKNKLGMADVWFGIFQGLFLTPFFVPVCLGIEAVAALCMIKKIGRKTFPFIPFMSLGLIITVIAPRIVSALEAFFR